MKAENVYNQFLVTGKYLLKELDYYGVNQFKTRIPQIEWTIGELYDYLLNSTLGFYIPQINACLEGKTGSEGKKKFKGKFYLWYGRIPAIFKYTDASLYKPVQPESPEKVKDSFYRLIKIMHRTAQAIDNGNLECKTEHPAFGMLTALEWYRLIEMNFKFHLKTKFELDKAVRSAYIENKEEPEFYEEEIREPGVDDL